MNSIDTAYVKELFSNLGSGQLQKFFERVADDVNWRVMGTHPLASTYHGKRDIIPATFDRVNRCLTGGVKLNVTDMLISGNIAVVEMESIATAKSGKPFHNTYCWIVEFDEKKIVRRLRAYVDSALVQQLIDENEG